MWAPILNENDVNSSGVAFIMEGGIKIKKTTKTFS
jgi:hypothetical protein